MVMHLHEVHCDYVIYNVSRYGKMGTAYSSLCCYWDTETEEDYTRETGGLTVRVRVRGRGVVPSRLAEFHQGNIPVTHPVNICGSIVTMAMTGWWLSATLGDEARRQAATCLSRDTHSLHTHSLTHTQTDRETHNISHSLHTCIQTHTQTIRNRQSLHTNEHMHLYNNTCRDAQ